MLETLLPPLQRTLLFAGVLLLVGVVAWRRFVEPSLASHGHRSQGPGPRASRLAMGTSAALLPIWGLALVTQVMGFRDPFAPLSEDLHFLLRETFWGTVWVGQGLLLPALVALFAVRDPGRLLRRAGTFGVVLLVVSLSLSSHAMSVPFNRPLAVAVDSAHTLGAGAWIGTLALILILQRGDPNPRSFALQIRAFSPLALGAVGLLLFMGLVLAGVHLGEARSLWSTSWGRILSLKVVVVGTVLFLGFLNWRKGLPVVDTMEGAAAVRRRATFEVCAAAVVVVLTAVLTGTALPPRSH